MRLRDPAFSSMVRRKCALIGRNNLLPFLPYLIPLFPTSCPPSPVPFTPLSQSHSHHRSCQSAPQAYQPGLLANQLYSSLQTSDLTTTVVKLLSVPVFSLLLLFLPRNSLSLQVFCPASLASALLVLIHSVCLQSLAFSSFHSTLFSVPVVSQSQPQSLNNCPISMSCPLLQLFDPGLLHSWLQFSCILAAHPNLLSLPC